MDADALAGLLRRAADTDPARARASGVLDALGDYAKGKRKEGALRHALERFEKRTNPMIKSARDAATYTPQNVGRSAPPRHLRVEGMRAAARELIQAGVLPQPFEHPRVQVNFDASDPDSGLRLVYASVEGLVDVQFSATGWYEGDPDILGIWDKALSADIHADLARPNPKRRR